MYVHLGGELVISVRDIVAVLDARLVAGSPINQDLVEKAAAGGQLRGAGMTPQCKALVVTRDGTIFTSEISASTLARRMTQFQVTATAWEAETQS